MQQERPDDFPSGFYNRSYDKLSSIEIEDTNNENKKQGS